MHWKDLGAVALIAFLGLSGCAPDGEVIETFEISPGDVGSAGPSAAVAETGEGGLADIELCDAADYRPLIGGDIAATTFPRGPMLRVFGENDIISQEYIPQRTNVVYDTDGRITRVWCG